MLINEVKILFENEDFMCIDKPAGLVVHSDGRTEEDSLVDWVKDYFESKGGGVAAAQKQKNIGNPHTLDSGRYVERWGIVNRLDRDTAGLILIAKNQNTFDELQRLFKEHKITKSYLAAVWGELSLEKLLDEQKIFKTENQNIYLVKEKITRHKKDPRIWTCGFTAAEGGRQTGLDAVTLLEVQKQPFSRGENISEVKLRPLTGRTHQLRLHCRFLGHPIVGDDKYGLNGKINEHSTRQIKDLLTVENVEKDKNEKLKLVARSLEFELGDEKYFFESGFGLG